MSSSVLTLSYPGNYEHRRRSQVIALTPRASEHLTNGKQLYARSIIVFSSSQLHFQLLKTFPTPICANLKTLETLIVDVRTW